MKKRIISLSILLGLFMCTGLYTANKHIEIRNCGASINASVPTIELLAGPGINPPYKYLNVI